MPYANVTLAPQESPAQRLRQVRLLSNFVYHGRPPTAGQYGPWPVERGREKEGLLAS